MCNLVAEALDNATRALLRADLWLAEQVITDDARIDDLRTAAEQQAFTLLVRQAPVATTCASWCPDCTPQATSSA